MATPVAHSSLIGPDGRINASAWLDYWSALWSAPSQPGYAQLVRESLARLVQFASSLETIAKTGPPGAATDGLVQEARDISVSFGGYGMLAFTSNDGPTLQTRVVTPLLTDANGPLWRLAGLQNKIVAVSGIIAPDWSTTLKREVIDPLAGAAQEGLSLLALIAIGVGAFFLWRTFGSEGGGA